MKALLVNRQRQLLLRGGFQFFALSRDVKLATDALMAVPHSRRSPSLAFLCIKVTSKLRNNTSSCRSPSSQQRSCATAVPASVPTPPQQLPQRCRFARAKHGPDGSGKLSRQPLRQSTDKEGSSSSDNTFAHQPQAFPLLLQDQSLPLEAIQQQQRVIQARLSATKVLQRRPRSSRQQQQQKHVSREPSKEVEPKNLSGSKRSADLPPAMLQECWG